ncbi:MAG: hypothetical protein EOP90_09380 [Lysobacteraceae bacterium]|nr:MAG: hypothetical protein EOP90_09380 [Xanthomonadaceae bacterium]
MIRCGAAELTSLGELFILVLAPFFARLRPHFDSRGGNPSKPAESAYGLIIAGLDFLMLVWSAHLRQANGLTHI